MQGQTTTLMCTGRLCQGSRVERAPLVCERSATVATLTHLGFCPLTTVRMRSGLLKGPLGSAAAESARIFSPRKLNQIQIFSQNTRGTWRNVWNLCVFLREPPQQFTRRKPHDNAGYINNILVVVNLLLPFGSFKLTIVVYDKTFLKSAFLLCFLDHITTKKQAIVDYLFMFGLMSTSDLQELKTFLHLRFKFLGNRQD